MSMSQLSSVGFIYWSVWQQWKQLEAIAKDDDFNTETVSRYGQRRGKITQSHNTKN